MMKYVNLHQTPEERRDKYRYCRCLGLSVGNSRRLRDWHWSALRLRAMHIFDVEVR
jgi:hypothetical protein